MGSQDMKTLVQERHLVSVLRASLASISLAESLRNLVLLKALVMKNARLPCILKKSFCLVFLSAKWGNWMTFTLIQYYSTLACKAEHTSSSS